MDLPLKEFDSYVKKAIDALEPAYKQYLEQVPVILEDVPADELARKMQLSTGVLLLGLFQGVPLQHHKVALSGPNQITLFRKNIMAVCNNKDQLAEQIRKTVVHELGHYLGFSEQQLREHNY